jgi:hypothetical protein
LKGYLSNTTLTKNEIIENYGHLWKIEKAFRQSFTPFSLTSDCHYEPVRARKLLIEQTAFPRPDGLGMTGSF